MILTEQQLLQQSRVANGGLKTAKVASKAYDALAEAFQSRDQQKFLAEAEAGSEIWQTVSEEGRPNTHNFAPTPIFTSHILLLFLLSPFSLERLKVCRCKLTTEVLTAWRNRMPIPVWCVSWLKPSLASWCWNCRRSTLQFPYLRWRPTSNRVQMRRWRSWMT